MPRSWCSRPVSYTHLDVYKRQVGRTAIDFGVYGAPETFLVDADGIVRWKHVGPLNDDIVQNELLPALAAAEQRK